jgi:hypothetical protein
LPRLPLPASRRAVSGSRRQLSAWEEALFRAHQRHRTL